MGLFPAFPSARIAQYSGMLSPVLQRRPPHLCLTRFTRLAHLAIVLLSLCLASTNAAPSAPARSNPGPSPITTTLTAPSPVLPRTNLVAQFQIKRGFRIELVASDPLVCAPAALAFDESGRLFVAEMRDYPDKRNQTPHLGRIRMLQDTDGDGVYDSSTIYADELATPSAIICYGGGIFVAAAPDILYFKDTARNGLADQRRIVFSGFGEPGQPAPPDPVFINNFNWGPDNRIHAGAGEFGGKLQASGSSEPLFV